MSLPSPSRPANAGPGRIAIRLPPPCTQADRLDACDGDTALGARIDDAVTAERGVGDLIDVRTSKALRPSAVRISA